MKMSLKWHMECLKNMKRHAEQAVAAAARAKAESDKISADVDFYERQILAAIADDKDGFDQDKFMKNER